MASKLIYIVLLVTLSIVVGNNQDFNHSYVNNSTTYHGGSGHEMNYLFVVEEELIVRKELYGTMTNTTEYWKIHRDQQTSPGFVAFDCSTKKIYFTTSDGISSANYNDTKVETTFHNDNEYITGFSIDWQTNTIYYTQTAKRTLKYAKLKTKERKDLINEDLYSPIGIAVHPYEEKVYWSDVGSRKLQWCNLNGTERGLFLAGESILTHYLNIDFFREELCWTDIINSAIACTSIYGDEKIRFVIEDVMLTYFAITHKHYYGVILGTSDILVWTKNGTISKPIALREKSYGNLAIAGPCPLKKNRVNGFRSVQLPLSFEKKEEEIRQYQQKFRI